LLTRIGKQNSPDAWIEFIRNIRLFGLNIEQLGKCFFGDGLLQSDVRYALKENYAYRLIDVTRHGLVAVF